MGLSEHWLPLCSLSQEQKVPLSEEAKPPKIRSGHLQLWLCEPPKFSWNVSLWPPGPWTRRCSMEQSHLPGPMLPDAGASLGN